VLRLHIRISLAYHRPSDELQYAVSRWSFAAGPNQATEPSIPKNLTSDLSRTKPSWCIASHHPKKGTELISKTCYLRIRDSGQCSETIILVCKGSSKPKYLYTSLTDCYLRILFFWDMTLLLLVIIWRRFGGAYCLDLFCSWAPRPLKIKTLLSFEIWGMITQRRSVLSSNTPV